MKKTLFLFLALVLALQLPSQAQKKKKKKQKKVEAVIGHAQSYKGTPYKYGGTSRKGIDCSALMQNCFANAGYKIPRTAKEQSKYGKKIGWKSIKPGDVVFFKFKQKGERWYHSGLITRVGNDHIYFIHASSSRGVVESDLMSKYYKKNVKNFRRVI